MGRGRRRVEDFGLLIDGMDWILGRRAVKMEGGKERRNG